MAEPEAGRESFEEFAAGALPALITHGHIMIVTVNTTQTAGVVVRQASAPGATVSTDSQVKLTVPSH